MSTSATYIPIQIWVGKGLKRMSYELFKQVSYGNAAKAKSEKKKIQLQYPEPKYLVKQKDGYVIVYKK